MIVDSVMTDHPSWLGDGGGGAFRAVRCGGSVWALSVVPVEGGRRHRTIAHRVSGTGDGPVPDVIDPVTLTGEDEVVSGLRAGGQVVRWRNPDLWDALATSIIRQVIRAGQARKLYQLFCQVHGESVRTDVGQTWLFPTPQTVSSLPDAEFARLGMAFKAAPLRAAAAFCQDLGPRWEHTDPAVLSDEVQNVRRIGPWTAGATIADLTNDYALYPFADLAVRTWAKLLAPGTPWPDTESAFARVWSHLAGEQLSDWTLLTLAWGARHATSRNPKS